MLYNVTFIETKEVLVSVDADSQEEAVEKAQKELDLGIFDDIVSSNIHLNTVNSFTLSEKQTAILKNLITLYTKEMVDFKNECPECGLRFTKAETLYQKVPRLTYTCRNSHSWQIERR